MEEGVLTEEECEEADFGSKKNDINYEKMYKNRYPLLRKAYERSDISKDPDYGILWRTMNGGCRTMPCLWR